VVLVVFPVCMVTRAHKRGYVWGESYAGYRSNMCADEWALLKTRNSVLILEVDLLNQLERHRVPSLPNMFVSDYLQKRSNA
jgi:hypothetical protein